MLRVRDRQAGWRIRIVQRLGQRRLLWLTLFTAQLTGHQCNASGGALLCHLLSNLYAKALVAITII